jgi:hypothetical protein
MSASKTAAQGAQLPIQGDINLLLHAPPLVTNGWC